MNDNLTAPQNGQSKFRALPAVIVFYLALLCVGLFHEMHSGLFCVALVILLCVTAVKNKTLKIRLNFNTLAISVVVISYLLSALWATDRGSALIGFVKFLPVLLFALLIMQYDGDAPSRTLAFLPHFAAFSVAISAILMQLEPFERYFSVAGRLSGFFEYPNTFALFCLLALLTVLDSDNVKWYGAAEIALLAFGILYSGSRFVFAISVAAVVASLIINRKKKKVILTAIPSIGVPAAAAAIIAAVSDGGGAISRFTTTSLGASTFVGRFLYWLDALPVILRHPFGSGYLTYYLTEQSFQNGVYSVRYMHNDFLQFAFDVGWIPAALFAAFIIYNVFRKGIGAGRRLMILVFAAHAFVDFDLQFVAMFFLLILLTDDRRGKVAELKAGVLLKTSAALLAAACVYMTTALAFALAGNNALSAKIYPYNTENNVALMLDADADEREPVADRILDSCDLISSAYDVKATAAFSAGDFKTFIEYAKKSLETAPYNYDNYSAHMYMLAYGISLYANAGDTESAKYCMKELVGMNDMFDEASKNRSPLADRIKDKFPSELPEELSDYVKSVKEALS